MKSNHWEGSITRDTITHQVGEFQQSAPERQPWARLAFFGSTASVLDAFDDVITIGRKSTCDIVVKHPAISNRHCKVFRKDLTTVILEDTSSNGTFLNSKRMSKGDRALITNGAQVSLVIPNSMTQEHVGFQVLLLDENAEKEGTGDDDPRKKYDIRHVVGSGSFATVYECVCRTTGDKFAMKVIEKKGLAGQMNNNKQGEREKSMMDEVAILYQLDHPLVIKTHDFYDTRDNVYIVMDYLPRGDLLTHLMNTGVAFKDNEARFLMMELNCAVAYLHEQGIVHRDLKPENILLTVDGHIKISDFGLSRVVGQASFMKTVCGTPMYLAPEVLLTHEGHVEGYGKAVDLWAMGVILFVILTGEPPFDEHGQKSVLKQIQDEEWEFPPYLRGHIAPLAQQLTRGLMCLDPAKRFTTADVDQHPWMLNQDYSEEANENVYDELTATAGMQATAVGMPKQATLVADDVEQQQQLSAPDEPLVQDGVLHVSASVKNSLRPSPSQRSLPSVSPLTPKPSVMVPAGNSAGGESALRISKDNLNKLRSSVAGGLRVASSTSVGTGLSSEVGATGSAHSTGETSGAWRLDSWGAPTAPTPSRGSRRRLHIPPLFAVLVLVSSPQFAALASVWRHRAKLSASAAGALSKLTARVMALAVLVRWLGAVGLLHASPIQMAKQLRNR